MPNNDKKIANKFLNAKPLKKSLFAVRSSSKKACDLQDWLRIEGGEAWNDGSRR